MYEKHVYFIFLVILAILSCSGFRIDNSAMMMASSPIEPQHRIRHHRQFRSQPASRRRPSFSCQEQDIATKTYFADIVLVASAQTRNRNPHGPYTVYFRHITEVFKHTGQPPLEREIALTFTTYKRHNTTRCDYDRLFGQPPNLIRTVIKTNKKYVLFLKSVELHKYTVSAAPVLYTPKKKRLLGNDIRRVLAPSFRANVTVESLEKRQQPNTTKIDNFKRIKLVCKVSGFPFPQIIWKLNGTVLHHNGTNVLINYKNKRSTLVIKAPSIEGLYECVAKGLNQTSSTKNITIPQVKSECLDGLDRELCLNGGICHYIDKMDDYFCSCANGFTGLRCGEKQIDDSNSMYSQNFKHPCDEGYETLFFCKQSKIS